MSCTPVMARDAGNPLEALRSWLQVDLEEPRQLLILPTHLHGQDRTFQPEHVADAWLRKCPSFGQTPILPRRRLYQLAHEAEVSGRDTLFILTV